MSRHSRYVRYEEVEFIGFSAVFEEIIESENIEYQISIICTE